MMERIDYIFIFCCILGICAIFVLVIHALIPKEALFESKEINIKRGKIIGSLIGVIIGIFISYYLWVNDHLDFFL